MSVAYFIVPEREVEGVDVVARGKALARSNSLTRVAQLARVRPLDEFFAMSPEEAAEFIEESGGDVPPDALPDEAWYDAAGIVRDLRRFEEALVQLAARGVRWHLGIDA